MLRSNSSTTFTANHHSLNNKYSPLGYQNNTSSLYVENESRKRKMSTTSLKQNIPDIQKLISDIKIKPYKHNTPYKQQSQKQTKQKPIQIIISALKQLEQIQLVSDEVKAVTMIMQSIQKKILSHNMTVSRRNSLRNSTHNTNNTAFNNNKKPIDFKIYNDQMTPFQLKRGSMKVQDKNMLQQKFSDISPIKQMMEDSSSRIMYSNFSLKEVEKSILDSRHKPDNSKNSSGVKIAISQFQQDCSQTPSSYDQVNRLNQQIKYLQKLLNKKTMSQPQTTNTNTNTNTIIRTTKTNSSSNTNTNNNNNSMRTDITNNKNKNVNEVANLFRKKSNKV